MRITMQDRDDGTITEHDVSDGTAIAALLAQVGVVRVVVVTDHGDMIYACAEPEDDEP